MIDNEPLRAKLRKAIFETTHVDCPCWKTGAFVQVPCLFHDGKDKFPIGAYAKSQIGETGGEMANESDDFAVVQYCLNPDGPLPPFALGAIVALSRIKKRVQDLEGERNTAMAREGWWDGWSETAKIEIMRLRRLVAHAAVEIRQISGDEDGGEMRLDNLHVRLTAEAKPETPAMEPYSDTMPLLTRVLIHEAETVQDASPEPATEAEGPECKCGHRHFAHMQTSGAMGNCGAMVPWENTRRQCSCESYDPQAPACSCPVHAQLEAVNEAIHPAKAECTCPAREALKRISPYFDHGCHLHLPDGSVFNPSDLDAALAAPCPCERLRDDRWEAEGRERVALDELEITRDQLAAANERAERAEARERVAIGGARLYTESMTVAFDTAQDELRQAVEALRFTQQHARDYGVSVNADWVSKAQDLVSRFDAQGGSYE